MGGSWEGAEGDRTPPWAALLSHTGQDTGSFSAVDSLHLAGATALLRRALTSSEPAAETIDLILALGFNSCEKEQAETVNFQSSDESSFVCHSLLMYWLSVSTYVLLRSAYVRIWWLLLFLINTFLSLLLSFCQSVFEFLCRLSKPDLSLHHDRHQAS